MPKLLNGIKGDSNPGSLDCESGILPLSYRATHVNHFLGEKHTKFDSIKNIHNVFRNFLVCVFRILFNNDPQQISFNSAKKLPRKWPRNMTFSYKK